MCYENPSGMYTIEQVDCTVYIHLPYSAMQYRSLIVCVLLSLSLSPYCASHTKSLLTGDCLWSGKTLMAMPRICTVLCSLRARQPDLLHS